MRAELTGLATARDRWSFALGCTGTVLRQPIVLRSLAYSVLMVGAVAGIVRWSAEIAYAPLRWGLVTLIGVLIAVSWLGRVSGPLGPVGDSRTARVVRAGGSLMVGVAAVGVIAGFSEHGNPVEQAQMGVPILGTMLACYLVGFVAVTANRSAANARMLRTAVGGGVGGALLWLAIVVLFPPIPASIGFALVVLIAAMGIPAYATAGQPSRGVLVALTAGTVMTLLVLTELVLLSIYAPASMIPDLAPAALTPADDLAQSRIELQDPYVGLMLIGALISATLGITSVALRQRKGIGVEGEAARVRGV